MVTGNKLTKEKQKFTTLAHLSKVWNKTSNFNKIIKTNKIMNKIIWKKPNYADIEIIYVIKWLFIIEEWNKLYKFGS